MDADECSRKKSCDEGELCAGSINIYNSIVKVNPLAGANTQTSTILRSQSKSHNNTEASVRRAVQGLLKDCSSKVKAARASGIVPEGTHVYLGLKFTKSQAECYWLLRILEDADPGAVAGC